jgi:DNA-binding CsgD family transcriptional regulator
MSASAVALPGCLTEAEIAVVQLIASGATIKEAAISRGVSIHTVETQLYKAYRKLGLKHRGKVILWAIRNGLGGV